LIRIFEIEDSFAALGFVQHAEKFLRVGSNRGGPRIRYRATLGQAAEAKPSRNYGEYCDDNRSLSHVNVLSGGATPADASS
jgi:hypothetical protein